MAVPPTNQLESNLLHDTRAVRDTAYLSFADLELDGIPSWAVAIITPDPDSGAATVPGGYIKAETGEFVIPKGATTVVIKKGKLQIVSHAPSVQQVMTTYSWTEPLTRRKRVLVPEDYYSPFVDGNAIVFRPTPEAEGIDQFGPVYLLFREWIAFVQEAFDVAAQSDVILYGKYPQADTTRLRQLVSDKNPLVATLAFRELIRQQTQISQDITRPLESATNHLRSTFAYAMLALAPPNASAECARAVAITVQAATKLEDIKAIAVAAFAAALFDSRNPEAQAGGRTVLTAAQLRLQQIGISPQSDPQLSLIFTKMEI